MLITPISLFVTENTSNIEVIAKLNDLQALIAVFCFHLHSFGAQRKDKGHNLVQWHY